MFIQDLKSGNNAERIYWEFIGQLSEICVLSPFQLHGGIDEGKDVIASGITESGLKQVKTEVKALLRNHYFIRDNDGLNPDGSIELELWSNAWRDDGSFNPDRSKWTPGWFWGMLHPEEFNRYQEEHERDTRIVQPDKLAFMLCTDKDGDKPFACVLFPDFNRFKNRLYQIAPFDLDNLVPPTHWHDYWKNEELNTPFNMWYAPLGKLIDLARITVFEDVPMKFNDHTGCPVTVQKARYEFIRSHASFSLDRTAERKKALKCGMAFNRDRGLPDNVTVPHMTYFDPEKLPSWVKDQEPDWLNDILKDIG